MFGRRRPEPETVDADSVATPDDGPPAHEEQATAVVAAPAAKRSFGLRRKPRPDDEQGTGEEADAGGPGADDRPPTPGRLRRERRELMGQRQDAVFHLGGLAFELYRRDLLPGHLLAEKALAVASIDARVREIDERLQEMEDERRARKGSRRQKDDPHAEVGCCIHCRAGFQAEAAYCWRCGAQINPSAGASDEDTAVILAETP